MAECCEHIAIRMEEPYQSVLRRIYRRCQESQASFRTVFCEEMEACFWGLPLDAADRDAFMEVFLTGGFQDKEMQMRCLEQGMEQLRNRIAVTEKELPGKCRLAVSLGGMGGLFMLIILL